MKLLLLACLNVHLCLFTALALPAPLNPYMSSENFKHVLHWTAAPGSPTGLKYLVYIRYPKQLENVTDTIKTWADVHLPEHENNYRLCVRSHFNNTFSPLSRTISFTPYLQTNITAPNVTVSGCGTCLQVNISLPEAHPSSGIQDIRHIYRILSFNLSVRRQGQETLIFTKTTTQTHLVIQTLIPGTEYCVQVKLHYMDLVFQPSSWECGFTSPARASVFAAVVSVAVVVVICLLAVLLVLLGLQYTGIICKLKEALPHTLNTSLWKHSLLSLEKTFPDPVSLPLWSEGWQRSPCYQKEDQEKDQEEDQEEDQQDGQLEDPYMNRGVDLSSGTGSSLRCGHVMSSQSAATVTNHSGSPSVGLAEQEEEKVQVMKADNWMKKGSMDCKLEELHKDLEKNESVNLFSVTIGAMDGSCEEEESEELLLLDIPCPSLLPQQTQDPDMDLTDLQAERNYYMHHEI